MNPHRSPHPRPPAPRANELLAELHAVYRDADRLYAGWSCPSSTECCRFGMTGREPYLTSIELGAVRKAVGARGGMRSWKAAPPAADPTWGARKVVLPVVRDERTCPLLDAAGRCAVYQARPLGCRTFFCDRAEPGARVKQPELNALVRRIQAIAERHEPGGERGRPLTRALLG